MLNISQVTLVRTDSTLCRKELTVHWSVPNSLIRSYLQPCTNSMWGDESEGVVPIIWLYLVCSTPLLAPRIGLYTASVVSLKDALIGWSASDYDAPIQLWRIQINTGYTLPSPTWRASPTWRKQKAFPLPGTAALWVFKKFREFPEFAEAADSPMLADMGRETV